MKFFILLAVVATASAIPYHAGIVNTGQSAVSRHDDGLGNYNFGYNEDHATGGTFRKESGTGGHGVQGSYGLRDADGRMRTVNYVADALGFRASVSTNEPGTDVKQDPAAVNLNYGGHLAGHIPAPLVHAPLAHGPILAHGAPLVHGGPLLAHGAPLAHGGLAYGHGGPLLAHGGLPLAHGGPVLAHGGPVLGHGLGHY
ncbi:hypothetical protein TYRP_013186 [Tyrophagus putrescentiae]|nr:hypothetical protein TYRP_013186 [Tyrophagus putrescentiae]